MEKEEKGGIKLKNNFKIYNNSLVVRLNGELDISTVPEFKETIIDKMKNNNLKHLVLNFKKVNFIDSSGLGAILGRYRTLDKFGGKVVLVNLNPQVKKIFTLAGMLKIMDEYSDEKKALYDLKKRGNK
ncbi:MAG: anti-sigma F factor antagonist [Halothermotrichaceae bacterium]